MFLTRVFVTLPWNVLDSVIDTAMKKTFRSLEAPMHPQLRLMLGGAIFVVQFGDAIAICSRGSHPSLRVGCLTDHP